MEERGFSSDAPATSEDGLVSRNKLADCIKLYSVSADQGLAILPPVKQGQTSKVYLPKMVSPRAAETASQGIYPSVSSFSRTPRQNDHPRDPMTLTQYLIGRFLTRRHTRYSVEQ